MYLTKHTYYDISNSGGDYMEDYYSSIKELLINNELTKKAKDYSKNRSDLTTYYEVGKLLDEAQGGEQKAKYGNKLIKNYSIKLTEELGKGYSERSLNYMRKFYIWQKRQPIAAQLSWSHYIELLSIKDDSKIKYYIDVCKKNNLSRNELRNRIKSEEYERLDAKIRNKIINKESVELIDTVKNPILIRNTTGIADISEKMLQKLILEDIPSFLNELGDGYSFIKNEYKIKLGNMYNYIDLLLFNIKYNCYVVVELKVTELKKEHIGQIEFYMNYIDNNLKTSNQNKTIGILIVKENNQFVIKYKTNDEIISRVYELV